MLEHKDLVALGKQVALGKNNGASTYSYNGQNVSFDVLNETLRREFAELAPDYRTYQDNKNKIFKVIEEVLTDVVPKKVAEAYDRFAEVRHFAQGDRILFRRKLTNNNRAKSFITRVGLAGRYEIFKLGKAQEAFEVRTSAIGGAYGYQFEEFLDGRVDFAELVSIVRDGMAELISKEIGYSLKASINQLPAANRVAVNGFDEAAMDKLIMIASQYGVPTIYCTYEFAVRMIPQEAWRYTERMKEEINTTGRLANYKGTQVVILEQGFEDETNSRKVIDPGYAWVIPSGANQKPVKVAFEGSTQLKEISDNADWSMEFHTYQKVGVVTMLTNDICAYVDTALMGQMDTWNLEGINGHVITYDGRLSGQIAGVAEEEVPGADEEP